MISEKNIKLYGSIVNISFGVGWFMFGLGAGLYANIEKMNPQYDILMLSVVGVVLITVTAFLSIFMEQLTGWTTKLCEVEK